MAEKTTKERLVEAASRIFAEKGFREATVAEICEAAGANIAAVNYHFGDKSNLYREVWNFLSKAAHQQFPVPESHEEIGAEAWLRLFLQTRIESIMAKGPAGLFPQIIHREMNEFTPMHEELFTIYLRPNHQRVGAAIKAFLEVPVSREQLDVATLNFMGVHFSMNAGYQKHRDNPKLRKKFPKGFESELLIKQVEAFAIGGLKEVKKGLQA